VPPIRVLVSDLHGMLSEIIMETLDAAPDIAVAVASSDRSALSVADATEADVAILGGESTGLPTLGAELLRRRPWMNVLTLRGDGRQASLYQLRPVERPLGDISPQTLLDAVRESARRRP
jgi:chemotaxis response regulator CheB